MKGLCRGVEIKGILSAVPVNEVSNFDYIKQFDKQRIKKQIQLTGIEKRRVCTKG